MFPAIMSWPMTGMKTMTTLMTIQPYPLVTTISHMKWGGRGGSNQEDDGCGGTIVVAAGRMATAGGGRVAIAKRMARQEAGQQWWQLQHKNQILCKRG